MSLATGLPMHFDDRLATVLRVRAGGTNAARIQYRQLIDLLGTMPSEARGEVIDSAFVRLSELGAALPAADRAAVLAQPGMRLRSPRLLAQLARGEAPVAIAAMQTARLSETEWLDLIPVLPITARGHVRQRRDLGPVVEAQLARLGINDRALPPMAASNDDSVEATAQPAQQPVARPREGIGAIVERIEAFRRRRAEAQAAQAGQEAIGQVGLAADTHVPVLAAFDFTCDAAGRLDWAEGSAAPMVSGMRLAARDAASPAHSSAELGLAFRRCQPIRAATVTLIGASAIAGEWQVDAAPRFDDLGHFTGYRGRFRRPAPAAAPLGVPDSEADRVRQLLHELRTPVNAIQGFAEVIQQQLFGPTPHEYRAHAATIAGDAARMLAGFDELERLARLDSGAMKLDGGSGDLAAIISETVRQLEAHTAQRESGFDLDCDGVAACVPLAREEAERLVWRLLATLASAAAPGERLRLRLRRKRQVVRLTADLPASLLALPDIFRAEPSAAPGPLSAGMFGTGFALRLARAEARAAGGMLEQRGEMIRLELPLAAKALISETGLINETGLLTENKGNAA
ncbi:MAG: histidine kinase dimerization/phospho-acceptor domain-containing protein [Novosphingobium sp.]